MRQTHAEPAGSPSAEALFAMRVASEVARRMHEAGRELRFSLAPAPARVAILLCDVDGVVLSRPTVSHAMEIALGGATPEVRMARMPKPAGAVPP